MKFSIMSVFWWVVLAATASAAPVSLNIDDGSVEQTIGSGSGQFIWLNRFTPDPSAFPFQLEQVSVVYGSSGVSVGDAVEILVYEDVDGDGDPGTGAVLRASFNATIQHADELTFSTYALPVPVSLNGPGDVLIAVVSRFSFLNNIDFPAALDNTTSAGRSWVGTYAAGDVPANPTLPADSLWGTIDSFGLPGNWLLRGLGTTQTSVVLINDQLALDSISGKSFSGTPHGTYPTESAAGVYSFTATFCNTGIFNFSGLLSNTTRISPIASLVSRHTPTAPGSGGVGSEQVLLQAGDYVDGLLEGSECVDITYDLGLTKKKRFSFRTDIWGVPEPL